MLDKGDDVLIAIPSSTLAAEGSISGIIATIIFFLLVGVFIYFTVFQYARKYIPGIDGVVKNSLWFVASLFFIFMVLSYAQAFKYGWSKNVRTWLPLAVGFVPGIGFIAWFVIWNEGRSDYQASQLLGHERVPNNKVKDVLHKEIGGPKIPEMPEGFVYISKDFCVNLIYNYYLNNYGVQLSQAFLYLLLKAEQSRTAAENQAYKEMVKPEESRMVEALSAQMVSLGMPVKDWIKLSNRYKSTLALIQPIKKILDKALRQQREILKARQ